MPDYLKINSSGMQCIGAYRAEPVGPPKGGIVVIQEIFGVNAHIRDVVDRFAEAGYVAIAPAFFDHVESDVELNYDAAGIARGLALVAELDIDQVMADVGSAADSINSAGKIGVVGYCWGGTIAMLAASRLGLAGRDLQAEGAETSHGLLPLFCWIGLLAGFLGLGFVHPASQDAHAQWLA